MKPAGPSSLQALVFSLVASAFTVVYITQPVLPVIEHEFAVDARAASLSVSMVIFGIAVANLPFGMLQSSDERNDPPDRHQLKPEPKLASAGGSLSGQTDCRSRRQHRRPDRDSVRATEPWGWQVDGHHLNVNYFVIGDQVVMAPAFLGSEPVFAQSGKYAGTRVFEAEEAQGLALIRSLDAEQRGKAVVSKDLPRDLFTSAFRDNHELRYEGIVTMS